MNYLEFYIGVFKPLLILAGMMYVYVAVIYLVKRSKYIKSDYYRTTKTAFHKVCFNKGAYGEYLSSRYLEELDGYKKFLYNIYLEKNEEETTEIDVLMLHTSGIYVLESKNYSGWIFGREQDKNWKQTLQGGKKSSFYNPVKQNRTHIKYLSKALKEIGDFDYCIQSLIVFSERCTLKKIEVYSENLKVIKRDELLDCCQKLSADKNVLTIEQIDRIYNLLAPHCNVSEEVKKKHIDTINEKRS